MTVSVELDSGLPVANLHGLIRAEEVTKLAIVAVLELQLDHSRPPAEVVHCDQRALLPVVAQGENRLSGDREHRACAPADLGRLLAQSDQSLEPVEQ